MSDDKQKLKSPLATREEQRMAEGSSAAPACSEKISQNTPSTCEKIRRMESLLSIALEHIEQYDDGMAGWIDEARAELQQNQGEQRP